MSVASCAPCGWSKDYATEKGRNVGLTRHRRRNGCLPVRPRLAFLGLPVERTVDEWLDHPTAIAELFCVVFGLLSLNELGRYRAHEAILLRERLADLTDDEQRRLARSDAIRARLAELVRATAAA